jgi:hypothetical protein
MCKWGLFFPRPEWAFVVLCQREKNIKKEVLGLRWSKQPESLQLERDQKYSYRKYISIFMPVDGP